MHLFEIIKEIVTDLSFLFSINNSFSVFALFQVLKLSNSIACFSDIVAISEIPNKSVNRIFPPSFSLFSSIRLFSFEKIFI